MTQGYRALIVTRQFPPDASVGIHRVVGLCRQLVNRGWDVTVIAARSNSDGVLDEGLLEAVPREVRVVRTPTLDLPGIASRLLRPWRSTRAPSRSAPPAMPTPDRAAGSRSRLRATLCACKEWLSGWLHVPDSYLGWLPAALWATLREGRGNRPLVIFSSAPVWTAHLVAATAARLLGAPLVADFRDPWCGSAFREQSIPSSAHRAANSFLERLVVSRAQEVTCAWDGIRQHLLQRYPHRRDAISTVINGFEPESIDDVPPIPLETTGRVFLHTGSFYGPRSPIPLLEALQRLQDDGSETLEEFVFGFVGPSDYHGRPLPDLVRERGVERRVRILGRVPHRQSIGLLKGADAAILCGQSGVEALASIPAKAYEYIGTGKPVLAVGAGEEVCEIMRRGGCRVWRASADAPTEIAAAVRDMLRCLAQEGPTASDPTAREQFTRKQMAVRLEQILLKAMAESGRERRRARESQPCR